MVLWLNPSWPQANPAPPQLINTDKKGLETGRDAAFMSGRHSAPLDSTELETCSSSSSSVSNRLAEKVKNAHVCITENA